MYTHFFIRNSRFKKLRVFQAKKLKETSFLALGYFDFVKKLNVKFVPYFKGRVSYKKNVCDIFKKCVYGM